VSELQFAHYGSTRSVRVRHGTRNKLKMLHHVPLNRGIPTGRPRGPRTPPWALSLLSSRQPGMCGFQPATVSLERVALSRTNIPLMRQPAEPPCLQTSPHRLSVRLSPVLNFSTQNLPRHLPNQKEVPIEGARTRALCLAIVPRSVEAAPPNTFPGRPR